MDRNMLIEAGIDYDEGVERFGGKPEIFEKYLKKLFERDYLFEIERQLDCKDISGAFRSTHDLKSATGNLSLGRCYTAICELTEQLRSSAPDADCAEAFRQAKLWYEKARDAVAEAES